MYSIRHGHSAVETRQANTAHRGLADSRGLFANGVWYCNCSPRMPAEHFEVKKESKNKGRWFYTCQKAQPARCDFFLWQDDAQPRMEAAVFSNNGTNDFQPVTKKRRLDHGEGLKLLADDVGNKPSRSSTMSSSQPRKLPCNNDSNRAEPVSPMEHVIDIADDDSTPSYKAVAKGKSDRSGMPVSLTEDLSPSTTSATENDPEDDDTPFAWPLSAAEEAQLLREADAILDSGVPRTPVSGKRRQPTNGAAQVSDEGLLTPNTTTPRKLHTELSSSMQANVDPLSPTPIRGPLANQEESAPKNGDIEAIDVTKNLASSVMALLATSKVVIPESTATKLHTLLTHHELRYLGVVRGRDSVRSAVVERDSRIAQLLHRIAALENDVEGLRVANVSLREAGMERKR